MDIIEFSGPPGGSIERTEDSKAAIDQSRNSAIEDFRSILEPTYRFGPQKCAIDNVLTRLIGKDNRPLLRRWGDRSSEAGTKQSH